MRDIQLGKDADDEGETISNVEQELKQVGIALRSSSGEFRNFGTVLDEVGARWSSFSDVEQASIAKALAGVRQQENLLTLMEHYNTALEYTEVALNSTGTATEKMQNYQDGLEASSKRFTASFENLSATVVDSGLISWFYDFGSGVSNVLSNIIDSTGAASIAIGALSTVIISKMGGKSKKIITKNAAREFNSDVYDLLVGKKDSLRNSRNGTKVFFENISRTGKLRFVA